MRTRVTLKSLYGLNVHETMLEEARDLPKADVLTMFHVLEHVYDPLAALKKAGELLAGDGFLVVEVPNMRLSRIDLPLGRRVLFPGYHSPEHLWFFTPRSLRALLSKQGFGSIAVTTYTFGLYPLVDLVALATNNVACRRVYLSLARVLTAPLSMVDAGLGILAVARWEG